ncbi:hypothetical protein BD779DRAFT_724588 [Infundibulicybe gibba]|nr:hypothetical protein BD779DRAFT_724588 [Infundibulicybe gibba]
MYHDSQQDEKENTPSEAEEHPHPSSKRQSPPLSSRAVSASRMAQARAAYSVGGGSRPLTDVPPRGPHARQVLPSSNRVTRAAKTPAKYPPIGRISEASCSESESAANEFPTVGGGDETDTADDEPPDQPPAAHGIGTTARQRTYALASNSLGQSSNSRPRRSASLSDALHQGEPDHTPSLATYQQLQQSNSRPGTSLGLNADANAGARRVVPEERERQEMELRVEYKSLHHESRREHEDLDHATSDAENRQSPSPTHNANRPRATHRRRDSDTLRSVNAPPSGSPTAVDLPPRFSPSTRAIAAANAKHRRSPTAPEVPTTSGMLAPTPAGPNSKTWASGNREDGYVSGREKESRENGRQPPAPAHQPQQQQYAAPTPVMAAPPAPAQLNRHIVVWLYPQVLFIELTCRVSSGEQKTLCAPRYDWQGGVVACLPGTQ